MEPLPQIDIDFDFESAQGNSALNVSRKIDPHMHEPEEEIALGPACWLWDYLRRSGAAGYFIPLSGGADSGAVATLVGSMCQLVAKAICDKDTAVIRDVERWLDDGETLDVFSRIRVCSPIAYSIRVTSAQRIVLAIPKNVRSSSPSRSVHIILISIWMDLSNALQKLFTRITQKTPRFKVEGGTYRENQALQNIQARLRMVPELSVRADDAVGAESGRYAPRIGHG